MKLFKNKVGRPSNDVKKKRMIFYVALVLAGLFTFLQGVLLTSKIIELKKIKGAVAENELIDEVDWGDEEEFVENTIFLVDFDSSSKNVKKFTCVNCGFESFIVNKLGKYKVNFTIENKDDYDKNYQIRFGSGEEYKNIKSIKVSKNSKVSSNITIDINKEIPFYGLSLNIMDGYLQYVSDFPIYYNKNFSLIDTYIDDTKLHYEKENAIIEKNSSYVIYNYYVDSYLKEKIPLQIENQSDKNQYYRFHTYKTNSVSSKTYNVSGECKTIKSKQGVIYLPTLTMSKKYPNRAGVLKVYSNKEACMSDKDGLSNKDVINKVRINVVTRNNTTKSSKLPSISKNGMTIKISKITNNSVKFTAKTSAKTFRSCTIYKRPASYSSIVTRYPDSKTNYKNKNNLTISNSKLKSKTNYQIQCASNGKITSLNFTTK